MNLNYYESMSLTKLWFRLDSSDKDRVLDYVDNLESGLETIKDIEV